MLIHSLCLSVLEMRMTVAFILWVVRNRYVTGHPIGPRAVVGM